MAHVSMSKLKHPGYGTRKQKRPNSRNLILNDAAKETKLVLAVCPSLSQHFALLFQHCHLFLGQHEKDSYKLCMTACLWTFTMKELKYLPITWDKSTLRHIKTTKLNSNNKQCQSILQVMIPGLGFQDRQIEL